MRLLSVFIEFIDHFIFNDREVAFGPNGSIKSFSSNQVLQLTALFHLWVFLGSFSCFYFSYASRAEMIILTTEEVYRQDGFSRKPRRVHLRYLDLKKAQNGDHLGRKLSSCMS
jgi:hypothetical protein